MRYVEKIGFINRMFLQLFLTGVVAFATLNFGTICSRCRRLVWLVAGSGHPHVHTATEGVMSWLTQHLSRGNSEGL